MAKNDYRGLFIAFEGLDGAGASIQASLLASHLERQGYRTVLTKEPTNNLIGGMIRGHLADEWQLGPLGLQLLFAADRAQHLEREIVPALQAGRVVITDRYILSSIAYGAHKDPKMLEWLENMNRVFTTPDITFVIKVRPSICAMRIEQMRFERLSIFRQEETLEQVWKVYESLAERYYQVHIIDGEREELEIINEITDITEERLGVKSGRTKSSRTRELTPTV